MRLRVSRLAPALALPSRPRLIHVPLGSVAFGVGGCVGEPNWSSWQESDDSGEASLSLGEAGSVTRDT